MQINLNEIVKFNNLEHQEYHEIDSRINKLIFCLNNGRFSDENNQKLLKLTQIIHLDLNQFYKSQYSIDLTGLDLSAGTNFYNVIEEDVSGSIYLSGKHSNNSIFLNTNEVDALDRNLKIKKFDDLFLYKTLTHELHHKLFNLDNRMDIKTGLNISGFVITTAQREGFVEYLCLKFMKYRYKDFLIDGKNLNEELENYMTEEYLKYRRAIEEYLIEFASKLHKYNSNLDNCSWKVDNLFMNFFFSGDRQIVDLAKEIGFKSILELKKI